MIRIINKILWLTVTLVIGLSTALRAQTAVPPLQIHELSQPLQTVFVMEHANSHLGGGVAISPDGKLLVYIGDDDGLYLRSVESEREQLLLKEAGPGLDVFTNPVFSSDGTRVFFSASGGTRYYPSNIYSIRIDGSGLKRLTQAKELPPNEHGGEGNAIYEQYFYSAQPAPDGTKILLRVYDAVQAVDNVALMDSDGSHLEAMSRGMPLFWSSDTQAVYYSEDDIVKRFDLTTEKSQTISGLKGKILGKLPDRDIFVIDNGRSVSLENVQDQSVTPLMRWNVSMSKVTATEGKKTNIDITDQRTLTSSQWSKSGRILLVYEGEKTEQFEIVEPLKQ